MSTKQNDVWLESAMESLEEAVDSHNYPLCLDIIADVFEKGFVAESLKMEDWLKEQPISKFAVSLDVQHL